MNYVPLSLALGHGNIIWLFAYFERESHYGTQAGLELVALLLPLVPE